MTKISHLLHLWFDDFKWKEFFAFLSAIYVAALMFLGNIGVPSRLHQTIAWAILIPAAIMYIINPKTRNWERKVPDNHDDTNNAAG